METPQYLRELANFNTFATIGTATPPLIAIHAYRYLLRQGLRALIYTNDIK